MSRHHFSTSKQLRQPIYAGSKVIGYVEAGVFHKNVKGSKHFLRQPPAIAFDVQSLEAAERAGARQVEVTDTETRISYIATIAHIHDKGFSINRGFGQQIALPMNGFICVRHGAPQQLQLFGGD